MANHINQKKPSSGNRSNQPVRKRKRKLHYGRILLLAGCVIALFAFFWGSWQFFHPLQLKSQNYIAEYGSTFEPLDNLKSLFMDSTSKISVSGTVDTSTMGDYPVTYTYKGVDYPFTVTVKDTEPPVVKLKDYTTDLGETVKAEDFIESIEDASVYTYKMDNKEDTREEGTYTVQFTVRDQYGNETKQSARLTRKNDTQPPTLDGFEKQVEILQGREFSENTYTVVDDIDSSPTMTVDSKTLNTDVPGVYAVKYTVRDRSNNEAVYTQEVTVKEDPDFGKPIAYFTFDDGPSENTLKIMDILDQYGAKGTFFVIGTNPQYYPIMKEIVDRGHTIALHTMTHDYATLYASDEAYFDDLQKISDVVEKETGVKADCIRFPGGSSNSISADYSPGIMTRLTKEVVDRGYQYFDWNGDSTDASGNDVPVEQLVANATAGIGTEKINILFHDTDAKGTTVEALPAILKAYQDAGYVFRGVSKDDFAPHHGVYN